MEDQGDVMDQAVGKLSSSKAQGPKNRCANGKVGKTKKKPSCVEEQYVLYCSLIFFHT